MLQKVYKNDRFFLFWILVFVSGAYSQNDVLSLSKGSTKETYGKQSRVEIDGLVFDLNTQSLAEIIDSLAFDQDIEVSRWLATDPKMSIWESPYASFGNNPVIILDPDGEDIYITGDDSKAQKQFFDILNARCGNILQFDKKTGLVSVKPGTDITKIQSSSQVSATLAKIVSDNSGPNTQRVNFKAVKESGLVAFDLFTTGEVDVKDMSEAPVEIQAAFLGHFITERFSTPNYEGVKASKTGYTEGHKAGVLAEIAILEETTNTVIDADKTAATVDEIRPESPFYPSYNPETYKTDGKLDGLFTYGTKFEFKFKVDKNNKGDVSDQKLISKVPKK